MAYTVSKAEVWVADIRNRAGTLARTLEAMTNAGAQLEFMIARKLNEDTSRVFLAPIKSPKQKKAARDAGLSPASNLHSIRIEGPDRSGLGAEITRAIAAEGVNLRGASGAAIGRKAVFHIAVETEQAMKDALRAARKFLSAKKR